MADELITCSPCGIKNASRRTELYKMSLMHEKTLFMISTGEFGIITSNHELGTLIHTRVLYLLKDILKARE